MVDANEALARASGAIGLGTIYDLGSDPPDPGLEEWPSGVTSDCSGFVGWCFGQGRNPAALGGDELSTNTIYDDAVQGGRHALFEAVADPEVGGIVVYPHYRLFPGDGDHAGHVAMVAAVRSRDDYDVIDCASSSFHQTGDAIRLHAQTAFTAHGTAAARARRDHPDLPVRCTRPPIFARAVG